LIFNCAIIRFLMVLYYGRYFANFDPTPITQL
jgi:hypothetical protein